MVQIAEDWRRGMRHPAGERMALKLTALGQLVMTTNDEDLCLRAVAVADGTVSVSAVSALGAILDRAVDN